MADILSQEEIDALLEVVDDDDASESIGEKSKKEEQQQVIIYDFKRPNRVSKEQLRAIKGIHDKLARNLASQISSVMRSIVEIRLHSVDQMTYGEFLMSLPSPTSFNVFSIKPLDGNCVLEINPSIAFPMIDEWWAYRGCASGGCKCLPAASVHPACRRLRRCLPWKAAWRAHPVRRYCAPRSPLRPRGCRFG